MNNKIGIWEIFWDQISQHILLLQRIILGNIENQIEYFILNMFVSNAMLYITLPSFPVVGNNHVETTLKL